jgi:hypothetical protein
MLSKNKILNPALILSVAALFLSACASGKPTEEVTGPVEKVVQPGAVEAARDAAVAQEESNHETRKDIFEAKTKLGIPTQEEEPAPEAAGTK